MSKIKQLIKIVNTKEKDVLIRESLVKLLYNLGNNENLNLNDFEQFILNLINRKEIKKQYTLSELSQMYINEKNPNGVSKQYLSKEIRKGNLKATMVGRNYLVDEVEVKRYLATKNIFLMK